MTLLRRRAAPFPAIVLGALLVLLLAFPTVPMGAGPAGAGPPASGSSGMVDAAAIYSDSFASRAGYDSAHLGSVSHIVPAGGEPLVVVTFRPSDPSLFSAPPVGGPLSVTEVAREYGLSPSVYAAAESYFESMGLEVVRTEPDRLSLTLQGSATAVGRAFGTDLGSGIYEGRTVTLPESPPSVPPSLEASIAAVTGLSSGFTTFALPAGLPEVGTSSSGGPQDASSDLVTPAVAREIYDLSSLYNVSGSPHYATGQGIALLLWGDGYDPNDLQTFFSSDYPKSEFPAPVVTPYPVDGAPAPSPSATNDPSKAPQELTLDIEWAGSMAPGANLDAVYAPEGPADQNYSPSVAAMTDALGEAVNDIPGVTVLSMSFGTPESADQSLESAWAVDLGVAMQEGITLVAATGDLGGVSGASCQGAVSTNYPADSPDVLAVGGTDPVLQRDLLTGEVTGLESESAWSDSGGGYSTRIPAPSWQMVGSAAGPIVANGSHRGTPDVSATAAYNYLYYAGQSLVAGGTSFSTPLWGGLIAEMNALYGSRLGFLTPRLYAIGAAQENGRDPVGIADVSTGSNCVAHATKGWDPVTGWGSPRALLLYEDLTATFVQLSVSASPSIVAPGGTLTVVARLTNRTSGAAIPGVPISVSIQATDSNGPCAGVWATGEIPSNATGFVTLSANVPICFLGAHGTSDVTVTSDGYYGVNSTVVGVNLLGLVPALAGIENFPWNVVTFAGIIAVGAAVGYVLGRGSPARPRPSPPRPGSSPVRAAPSPTVPNGGPPPSGPATPPPA